jgi:hypothetical protein
MLRLQRSGITWWQKPLTLVAGRALPAELAVLAAELGPDEAGVWLNSRGTRTGVVDLLEIVPGKFKTKRAPLPRFVSTMLSALYASTGLTKGAPDLVIWSLSTQSMRLVEVKCPHWDKPSPEQLKFLAAAAESGLETSIAEWEFQEARA